MFLFLKYYNQRKFYFGFIFHIPLILLMKLKLVGVEKVKKSLIASILKNEKEAVLNEVASRFFNDYKSRIIRKSAMDFIQSMDRDAVSYLVTASLDIWVRPFAAYFNFGLIATVAAYQKGIFTGNFLSPNCNGQEKVNRIKKEIDLSQYEKSIAFGDSSGDKPMLSWADESHFRFFS